MASSWKFCWCLLVWDGVWCVVLGVLIVLPRHESSSKLHVTFGRAGRGWYSSKNLPAASCWNTFPKPELLLLSVLLSACSDTVFWELSTAGCCPGDQFSHNPCAGERAEKTVPPEPGGPGEISPGWLSGRNLGGDPAPGHLSHLRWQSTWDHWESEEKPSHCCPCGS